MSRNIGARFAVVAALIGLALTQTPPAQALSFGGGKLYLGCATKAEVFAAVRTIGGKPQRITGVQAPFVNVYGRDSENLKTNFAVDPCKMMVIGSTSIPHSNGERS